MRTRAALAFVLVLAAPLAARAQSARYTAIVEQYRSGQYDEAVRALRELPVEEVERSLAEVTQRVFDEIKARNALRNPTGAPTVDAPKRVTDPIEPVWLEAALVLHTHAFASPDPPLASIRGIDELQPAVLAQAADYQFMSCWYLFMSSYKQGHGGSAFEAYSILNEATRRVTEHPEVQLAMGAVDEVAWGLLQGEHTSGERVFEPSLGRAEAAFRRALASAPELHEARLRLARVLTLRTRYDEALTTLAGLPPDLEDGYRYLRYLFEGDALERRGDLDRAGSAYARAVDIMPHAESATMALAHLLHAQGSRAESLARTRALTSEANDIGTDPWLWYRLGTAWRTDGYLEAMQAIVTRPPGGGPFRPMK